MFFATQPIEEPEHLGDMATLMGLFGGEDNVVFASDWPHHDFDHPQQGPADPGVATRRAARSWARTRCACLNLSVPVP